MLDPNKLRKDFPFFENVKKMQGNNLVYFDNAATTQKPRQVLDSIIQYYSKENANSHRGDYDIAHLVDDKVEKTRELVSKFLNCDKREVVFTSGTTMSLNLIAYGYGQKFLTKDDEILISEEEHSSNILPWYEVSKKTGAKVKFIKLVNGKITLEEIKKAISSKTKLISLAQVSNVLGYKIQAKEICKIAHENGILVSIDAAQSAPHMKIDVQDMDCDFLSFSGHKMCGPTGIGILYGKFELLNKMDSFLVGGGNNITYDTGCNVSYLYPPEKFEAGTLNLAGIYGLNAAIKYLNEIGLDNIENYEKELKDYAIKKLSSNKNIILYNKDSETGILTFNYNGVFAQDEATYLNSKGICVRSGQHCAKLLNDYLKTPATIRASFYFYNTKQEIDQLAKVLENGGNFLDAYFN